MDNIFQLINRVEKAYKGKGIFKFTSKDNTITYLLSIFLWIIGSVALFIANTKKCCISVYISSWIFYLVSFLILFYVDRTIQREENSFFQKNKNKSNEEKWYDGFRKRLSENNINSKDFPYIIKYYEEKINQKEDIKHIGFFNCFINLVYPVFLGIIANMKDLSNLILGYSIIAWIIISFFSYFFSLLKKQKTKKDEIIIHYLKLGLLDEEYTKRS